MSTLVTMGAYAYVFGRCLKYCFWRAINNRAWAKMEKICWYQGAHWGRTLRTMSVHVIGTRWSEQLMCSTSPILRLNNLLIGPYSPCTKNLHWNFTALLRQWTIRLILSAVQFIMPPTVTLRPLPRGFLDCGGSYWAQLTNYNEILAKFVYTI